MIKAPTQSLDITIAHFFEDAVEAFVNSAEKPQDFAKKTVWFFLRTFRGLLPVLIVDLIFAAVVFTKSVREAGVDLFEMPAHEKFDHRRNNGAGQKIGREHGEDDRHGQRLKKKFGHAAQKEDRHEHDADAQGRD